MADLKTQEQELANTRREVRNLQVMQMHPGRTAAQLKHLADLERSARAEVKLRLKAIAYIVKSWRQRQLEARPADLSGSPKPN